MASKLAIRSRQREHAKRRAFERYGLRLENRHMRELQVRIMSGEGEQIRLGAFQRRVLRLTVFGVECIVLASHKDSRIITFFPRDEWNERG